MHKAWDVMDVAGLCVLAFVVYKTVELGPYETAVLMGRCVRIFVVAVQGLI